MSEEILGDKEVIEAFRLLVENSFSIGIQEIKTLGNCHSGEIWDIDLKICDEEKHYHFDNLPDVIKFIGSR